MATVRFSKELTEDILSNARNKMEPAVQKARDQTPDASWGQRIYDILFGDATPILSQVPAEWLKTVDKIEIAQVGSTQCGMTFQFATRRPWPHTLPNTKLMRKHGYYGDTLHLLDHEVWAEFHAEVVAHRQRVQEAAKRRDEFVTSVKRICETYTTLAPALKAWPPLWELVPEKVKDKHRQIVEREQKKEVKLEVDLNKLTALSTAAKFGL